MPHQISAVARVAKIVPLRRFNQAHSWFDYRIPDELKLTVGQLVEIPFLHRTINGIVWDITNQTNQSRLKTVGHIVRDQPVVTSWQMNKIKIISEQGFVSIANLLTSIVPEYPKKADALTPFPHQQPIVGDIPITQTWWYRNRADVVQSMVAWLSQANNIRCVIVPTLFDGRTLQRIAREHGFELHFISSELSPAAYRKIYEGIRAGHIRSLIGTAAACFLPYPSDPEVILDQEEHPAHKQALQPPRLDARWLVRNFWKHPIVTTPAPSLTWYAEQKPDVPKGTVKRRILTFDPKHQPRWISPDLATVLDEKNDVVLIVPRGESGHQVRCQHCSWERACQRCGRFLRWRMLNRVNAQCLHCGYEQSLQVQCPRCQHQLWAWAGLSVSGFSEIIKKYFPNRRVSTSWPPLSTSDTWIGTYQVYQSLNPVHLPACIVLVDGDSLRAWPDFSADERAWQYLARLQSFAPEIPVLIQTEAAEDDFWQRWKRGDDLAWYQDELESRRKLQTPPFVDQWILRFPVKHSKTKADQQIKTLPSTPLVKIEALPLKSGQYRWLITAAPGHRLLTLVPDIRTWSSPWQIDPWVTSWLD